MPAAGRPGPVEIEGGVVKGPVDREQTRAVIPPAATSIAREAFRDCDKLTEVVFGGSLLTCIRFRAFSGCSKLRDLRLPSGLKNVCEEIVPWESGAFSNCTSITSLTIPASIERLGGGAFCGTTALETVLFERRSQLAFIGPECFAGSGLKMIEIPASVAEVGDEAFGRCRQLVGVFFTKGLKLAKLSQTVFLGTTTLKSVRIPTAFKGLVDVPKACKVELV